MIEQFFSAWLPNIFLVIVGLWLIADLYAKTGKSCRDQDAYRMILEMHEDWFTDDEEEETDGESDEAPAEAEAPVGPETAATA